MYLISDTSSRISWNSLRVTIEPITRSSFASMEARETAPLATFAFLGAAFAMTRVYHVGISANESGS